MWTALVLSLSAGVPPAQGAPAAAGAERDVRVLARAVWPVRHEKAELLVIRNGEELALAHGIDAEEARLPRMQHAVMRDVALLLKVRAINWDKQMLVVVAAGARPTGGYGVEVLRLAARERALTVFWKLNSPAPGSAVAQAATYPAHMVLLERFDGAVQADPALKDK